MGVPKNTRRPLMTVASQLQLSTRFRTRTLPASFHAATCQTISFIYNTQTTHKAVFAFIAPVMPKDDNIPHQQIAAQIL